MALRTGIVVVTLLIEHICRVLTTYRPAMNTVINQAVTAGHITSVQKDILMTFLDGANSACAIIKVVSGY
jgi:hypothetical protein